MKNETVREDLGEEVAREVTPADDVRDLSIDELCQIYGGGGRNRLIL